MTTLGILVLVQEELFISYVHYQKTFIVFLFLLLVPQLSNIDFLTQPTIFRSLSSFVQVYHYFEPLIAPFLS